MSDAASARRQRRTDSTKARLLDAALDVFCERGYDAASLTEITTRADLGAGTLYLHFKDKRSIYEATLRREGLALREQWLSARAEKPATAEELEAEVRLFCKVILDAWAAARPELLRLALLDGPALETWFVDEVSRVFSPVLAAHVRDAELLASLVIGALLAAGRFRLRLERPISSKRLTDTVVAFCVSGIAAEQASPQAKGRRKR